MADPPRYPDSGDYPGTPRWAKVFGTILLAVVLLFVILSVTRGPGGHGPGRHFSSDDAGGQPLPPGVAEGHTRPEGGH